tara:strand:+ start:24189 stop:24629 length:441 start_codon:yes stop_codon:yes gene_type:complete
MAGYLTKLILATSIAILLLVSVKTYQQTKQIAQLQQQVSKKSSQVIALNGKRLIDKFMRDGNTQAESMEAFALLIKMMEDEGVLIIDSNQTITAPTDKQFKDLRVSDINAMAKDKGINIVKFRDEIIEQAKKETDRMIKELEALQR